MVVKQERTGKLKWMMELREREWHPYVKRILVEYAEKHPLKLAHNSCVADAIYTFFDAYRDLIEVLNDELVIFCKRAKYIHDMKDTSANLQWSYKVCDNPNCGTCKNRYPLHYPYPRLFPVGTTRGKPLSVKREILGQFLIRECDYSRDQVDIFFDLRDLRHLLIRKYHYLVEEFQNMGFKVGWEGA